MLHLDWAIGDYVCSGAPLFHIEGDLPAGIRAKVASAAALGPERTLNQDVAYGIRMLVDIAERSLSSGPFEDPTTTVQAIDRLHDLMRQLATRPLPSGRHTDSEGTVRLTAPTLQWDGYVHLAFDEIRQAGAASPQVSRRLRAALEDLIAMAPDGRREPLAQQLELLGDMTSHSNALPADRDFAKLPDPSGVGSSAELVGVDRAARQAT